MSTGCEAYPDWKDAHRDAQRQANVYQRVMGIEKCTEYGCVVFRVRMLPKPAQRYGWELRCEVVEPDVIR